MARYMARRARGAKAGSTSPPRPGIISQFRPISPGFAHVPAPFDDIEIGQVVSLGAAAVDPQTLQAFITAFTPGWAVERGAPDAMVYAIWARLDAVAPPTGRRSSAWGSTPCAGPATRRPASCCAAA